jgi:hypothetical protein
LALKVQPQQAATVFELDLVQHAIRPYAGQLPVNLTLDFEHAHVSGH